MGVSTGVGKGLCLFLSAIEVLTVCSGSDVLFLYLSLDAVKCRGSIG